MNKFLLAVVLASAPAGAFAEDYAVVCTSPCAVQTSDAQGNTTIVQEPAGYVSNVIVWNGTTAYNPGIGYELKLDSTGAEQVGQTVTP